VEYTVASPSGTSVALEEMNVLYIGWNNKVRIAASGAGDDKISVSMTGGGGSINRVGAGQYIATVTQQTNDCMVNVSVDGKISSHKFRVRNIPDPVATVGNVPSNDNFIAGSFRNQAGVAAFIRDFPLDIKYSVTSFSITMDDENGDIQEAACQGNTWSPAALNIVRKAAPGRMVTIDNIRATGPDGKNRKIPGLVYYLK
jgi:gliding motility-associated protein GldM